MYDTIEEKLSNLIDIQAEGENETRELIITLEKKMSFKFPVITSHAPVVIDAVRDLVEHFEENPHYKVNVHADWKGFPEKLVATKETSV